MFLPTFKFKFTERVEACEIASVTAIATATATTDAKVLATVLFSVHLDATAAVDAKTQFDATATASATAITTTDEAIVVVHLGVPPNH